MHDGPQIRPKITTGNRTPSRQLYFNGQIARSPLAPSQHSPRMFVGPPNPTAEFGHRKIEEGSNIHTFNPMMEAIIVKGDQSPFFGGQNGHHEGMTDVWPQRAEFRKYMKGYQAAMLAQHHLKVTHKQIAKSLGISEGHLRNVLYRPTYTLSVDALQRAARLFGCSITEFIDDPNIKPAGQELTGLSDQARFFAIVLVKDLVSGDLSDDDRQELWEDFQRGLARIRKRKASGIS